MREVLFHAHHAMEERHWWFRARRRAILQVGMALLPARGRVVDVGCGTGADIATFPASYERHGVDQSETAIRFAQERHRDVDFRVASLPGDGAEPLRDADLVLLCDVLEHIEDDVGFLTWLITTMKPSAHLLLTVPADPRLWSPHDVVYGHFRRYTRESLAAVWSGLPVDVRLLAPFNRFLYPVARAARVLANRRGRGWGSEQGDLKLPAPPANWLLEQIFALETPAILGALEKGRRIRGSGVSLIAVLTRRAS